PGRSQLGWLSPPAHGVILALAFKKNFGKGWRLLGVCLAKIEPHAGTFELPPMPPHALFLVELRARLDLILRRGDRAESCQRICGEPDAECLVHHECPL